LQEANPELAKQWHHTKNGNLTPRDVAQFSHRKVWWRCNKGHEWQAPPRDRSRGNGCPYCSGRYAYGDNCLAILNPDLSKEWHPTKNGDLTPRNVLLGSHNKVWWKCDKGHEWEATISDRSSGKGCPECWSIRRRAAAGSNP